MTKPLEKDIEAAVGRKIWQMSKSGNVPIHYLKLTILGNRGWPDRLVLWPNRGILFIEFKRPGEQPRKLQEFVHAAIRKLGFDVEVHDNVDRAVESIQTHMAATSGTGSWYAVDSERARHEALLASWEGQD